MMTCGNRSGEEDSEGGGVVQESEWWQQKRKLEGRDRCFRGVAVIVWKCKKADMGMKPSCPRAIEGEDEAEGALDPRRAAAL